jgi:hypothetical protein
VPPNGEFMLHKDGHLSDQELLLAADGELSARPAERVQAHLAACWSCRTRKQEIERAIGEFVRDYRKNADGEIPPADGPRALLKAQLAHLNETQGVTWPYWIRAVSWKLSWVIGPVLCGLVVIAFVVSEPWTTRHASRLVAVAVPNPSLTPGATVLLNRREVCQQSSTNNKVVPVALQRRVFEEYGIAGADPKAYEVDYLVTPALGGADDIHNLWPHSYSATVWNASVKDALEDRLRQMVCDGQITLETAQREIASNWIEAYKKYFNTDRPLERAR